MVVMPAGPGAAQTSGTALPSFEELLAQLHMRHQLDVQTFRGEVKVGQARTEQPGPCIDVGGIGAAGGATSSPDQFHLSRPVPPAPGPEPSRPSAVDGTLPGAEPQESAGREEQSPWSSLDAAQIAPRTSKHRNSQGAAPSRQSWLPNSFFRSSWISAAKSSTSSFVSAGSPHPSWSARVFEDIAPKDLDFHAICVEKYPDRRWDDLSGQEKAGLIRSALKPKHLMINPHSRLMRTWDSLLAIALAFVGLVTPYEVVFLMRVSWAFFGVNRCVDLLFVLDICLQFFLQVEVVRPHRGGSLMTSDRALVRRRYLRSWFCLDALSVLPFELLGVFLAGSSPVWQTAKILRCLKLLRLAKLLRMLRSLKILRRWKDAVSMRFGTQRLLRFCVLVLLVSHWMACLWGLVGLTFGAELCDEEGRLVEVDLAGPGAAGASWVAVLFLGGKASPDHPCNHFEVYVASLHWAVMTLTSIGYGDIVPVRVEEYIVGICCMLVGGVLWAYVIGCVCSLISTANHVEQMFETNTDLLNGAMREASVKDPHKYREYLREAKAYDRRVNFAALAAKFSPKLRNQLMYHLMQESLHSVYYFQDPSTPTGFLVQVASSFSPMFFARRENLNQVRDCLCLMDRGTVVHNARILVHPSVFHEDFIVAQKKFRKTCNTFTLTYTQILVITKGSMEDLLAHYPEYRKVIYRHALKAAFCRAVHMVMAMQRECHRAKPEQLSLAQVFDIACNPAEPVS